MTFGRLNRYILGQLIRMFGFFGLVLAGLIWISRSVPLFDRIIGDGNGVVIFLELSALSLPELMTIAFPFAAFAAAVSVTNRMSSDSELTAALASGFSPMHLARPVALFAILAALATASLTHGLVPKSREMLALREAEIARDQTARLLTPGEFIDTADGATVFFEDIDANYILHDIMVRDAGDATGMTTYVAKTGALRSINEYIQVILYDGIAQTLRPTPSGWPRMTSVRFEEAQYTLSTALPAISSGPLQARARSSLELARADVQTQLETGRTGEYLLALFHARIGRALMTAIAVMVGFLPLVQGSYSRFGLARQIAFAIGIIVVLLAADETGQSLARASNGSWEAIYIGPVLGTLIITALMIRPIWNRHRPIRRRRAW